MKTLVKIIIAGFYLLGATSIAEGELNNPGASNQWLLIDKRVQSLLKKFDKGEFKYVISESENILEDLDIFRKTYPKYLTELTMLRKKLLQIAREESRILEKGLSAEESSELRDLVLMKLVALTEAKKEGEFDRFVIGRKAAKSIGYLEETLLRQKTLEQKLKSASAEIKSLKKKVKKLESDSGYSSKIKELEDEILLYMAAEDELRSKIANFNKILAKDREKLKVVEKENFQLKAKLSKIINRPKEIDRLEKLIAENKQRSGMLKQLLNLQEKRNSAIDAKVSRLLSKDEGSLREIVKAVSKLKTDAKESEVEEAVGSEIWRSRYEAEKNVTESLKAKIALKEVNEKKSGSENQNSADTTFEESDKDKAIAELKKQIFKLKSDLLEEQKLRSKAERNQILAEKSESDSLKDIQKVQVQNRMIVEKYVTLQEKMVRFKDGLQQLSKDHFFSYGVFGKKLEGKLSYLFPQLFPALEANDEVVPLNPEDKPVKK